MDGWKARSQRVREVKENARSETGAILVGRVAKGQRVGLWARAVLTIIPWRELSPIDVVLERLVVVVRIVLPVDAEPAL